MPDPTHIPDQDRLSQYQQVSTAVYHMLSVAQAGGLSEKRAQKIYHEIMDAYSTLNGSAFWPFRDEVIRVLVTPDSQFPDKDEDDDWRVTGRN